MTARRHPTGSECECITCGLFFGSPSAFDRHLAPIGCRPPADVLVKKTGEAVFERTERKGGPTWVLAGGREYALSAAATRQEAAHPVPAGHPLADVIECWLCPEPTVGDSDYCATHKEAVACSYCGKQEHGWCDR